MRVIFGATAPRAALAAAVAALTLCSALGAVNQGLKPPTGLGWIRWSLNEECPFSASPAAAVKEALKDRIVAQPQAVNQIISAVSAWESWLRRGEARPLVLALMGSTGVGKTATATALAAALLGAALPGGRDAAPALRDRSGLLQLSGSDYGEGTASAAPVLRRRLRQALAQLLYECHGTGVVVLDEAQKMSPAVLEALRPFVDQRSVLNYYADAAPAAPPPAGAGVGAAPAAAAAPASGRGSAETVAAEGEEEEDGEGPVLLRVSRLVLIIVADIGQDTIDRFLVAEGREAAAGAGGGGGLGEQALALQRERLARRLRDQLAGEWAGAGADLVGLVQSVVPFMPFAQPGVRALLAQHASALAEDAPALSGGAFDALVIDDDVPAHLSSRDVFSGYSVPVFEEGEEEGAMGGGPAGAPAQANASSAGVSADGLASADVDAAPPAPYLPPWCVEAHPPFWTSTYGARGVLFHDGSPARLVSALFARLGDEHPWDDGAGGAEGAAAQWRPILAPAPLQPGVGVGRWLMATLYSAAGGRLWGTTPERPNGGHVTSSAGAPHGKAPPRRVVLRLSASCAADQPPRADQAVSAATAAHLRRARHIFTASRCVQVLRGAPAADASTSGWEEACADVWSGPLLP